jgi:translation initiation factor IF-2
MSVRIHQLAKQIDMDNKELLELLRERGYEVKSVSSTIDNISAESIVKEFASSKESTPAEPEGQAQPEPEAETKPKAAASGIPAGAVVRSADEIAREKAQKQAEEEARKEAERDARRAAAAPTPPPPATPPAPAKPKTPPPPPPASGGPAKRPTPPPAPSTGAGVLRPSIPAAAVVRPAGERPEADKPKAATPAVKPTPTPAAAKAAPATPAPIAEKRPPAPAGPPKAPTSAPRPPAAPVTAEATAGEVPVTEGEDGKKVIHVKPPIVVRDFASAIGVMPFKLISELMEMGIFAAMNQTIEESVAQKIAVSHGFTLEIHHRGEQVAAAEVVPKTEEERLEEEAKLLEPRGPVVCVLGHVDHGKTTLIDRLRRTDVVSGEAGGITQHIGAYQIEHNNHAITILDTPGHAAFARMRQRGADITDIAILLVAADDGFMPQTDEALKYAQRAQNAIVVAINKCDSKGANVERVKQQMQERGIAPEDWGGETIAVPISALKGDGIDSLLDSILLQAEIMELKAVPSGPASGRVIESQIEQGRGTSATVIVEKGQLKPGDALICGEAYCRVKTMTDEHGKTVKKAGPATPVKVTGWSGPPSSGTTFRCVKNEREAKRQAEDAAEARKREAFADSQDNAKAVTIDDLFNAIATTQKKSLRIIVKADVHGSAEALADSLRTIDSSKVELKVLSTGVGLITKNDVSLASASDAAIVGFNVKLDTGVQGLAKHHSVRIIQHTIIYEIIDQVEDAMADLLDVETRERKLGVAEVRALFSIGKHRVVAGCMITEGKVIRDRRARVMRNGEVIGEGRISTLRRFKDDATEVRAGYECGINVEGMNTYQEGDQIHCFEMETLRPSLR